MWATRYLMFWSCYEDDEAGLIIGHTIMDNNKFSDWLEKKGLSHVVRFEGGYYGQN